MRPSRAVLASLAILLAAPIVRAEEPRRLAEGWLLQASDRVAAAGDAVSQPGFGTDGWHAASVPATVLAALVAAGVHPDPYFGMNLRSIPGTTYTIARNFSLVDIPAESPFRGAWWYRTEFDLPASMAGRTVWLRFDGINYRANVWLNGRRVAAKEDTAGAFRRYEMDVSSSARLGARNALAVEVFPPGVRDLAFNWVDWNPAPPDKNMGLWGPVSLVATGPVTVRHPYVTSRLDLPSLDRAHLTVAAEVRNATDHALTARVQGTIESVRFGQDVALGPKEVKTVRFTSEQFPDLSLARPRVWWPYQLGSPELYDLRLEAAVGADVSDVQMIRFGVREVSSELTENGHRLFKVNGRRVLIRGGGWASDMLLRSSPERLDAELRYVREMNLNTVRLEGKPETDDFFERTDRDGILVMAGWCCCDHWEDWPKWSAENRAVATASLRDQALRLRGHPSVFVWLNGSDGPPPPTVEKAYLAVLREVGWPLPALSSAAAQRSAVSGPSGVKMSGPYDYVPPSYWLTDQKHGGAFGFNTETSPGPAVPPIESLEQMLSPEHLWPMDAVWAFHAGGNEFDNLNLFTAALEARYGKATGAEDYARKSQALAYEGQRAMFEAYGRNKYTSTGVVQWMLNNAWPSLIWHLYDYYLRPGGGYFGTRKACEPLHVQYSYDDGSIVVVNGLPRSFTGLKVSVRIYDLQLTERFSREVVADVAADGVTRVLALPQLPGLTTTYFVRLGLRGSADQPTSENFYWLSTQPDVLDWAKSDWYFTPVRRHADLTALARLPPTSLDVSAQYTDAGQDGSARVRVSNTGAALAFQVRLKLTDGQGGREILPVFWDDNYLALMPGESRELHASYHLADRKAIRPGVEVEGWNAPRARAD